MRFNKTINFYYINTTIKTERINSDISKSDDFKNSERIKKSINEKMLIAKKYESYFINFN